MTKVLFVLVVVGLSPQVLLAQDDSQFPATARVLVEGVFQRCEGIAFNGEGHLYVAGNSRLWRVNAEGEAAEIADSRTGCRQESLR